MASAADVHDATHRLEKLDFHHPYTPYDVQEQFMRTVYDVLDKGQGQVGILESPTGTVSTTISSIVRTCCSYAIMPDSLEAKVNNHSRIL